jgi:hypothetical protein
MSKFNRENIDRKTNKPNPEYTEGVFEPDVKLNRADQVRRDDDVIRNAGRSVYDIDYGIKSFVEKEIQPTISDNGTKISVPVIFANGEKWDNVRRLGYMRDEKGMLQSPVIMLKRTSFTERDNYKTLDVNRNPDSNRIIHKNQYGPRNRYEDTLFPFPTYQPVPSTPIYVIDIPRYITVDYEMMLWCDFTTQLNDLVNQIFTYNRFFWGMDRNSYHTTMGTVAFETVNTVGEDRLIRATIPLTVLGTIQSEQETRVNTIKKMYSIKKVSFDMVIDVGTNIFDSTIVPVRLLQQQSSIMSGGRVVVTGGGGGAATIDGSAMSYLTELTDKIASYSNATTITVSGIPKINPVTFSTATFNEFDIYINGQYIDKVVYTWTPNDTTSTQTITFDTALLGYNIESDDLIVVHGRWA